MCGKKKGFLELSERHKFFFFFFDSEIEEVMVGIYILQILMKENEFYMKRDFFFFKK